MAGLTMRAETTISRSQIAWGVASRALPGQDICGDLHLVTAIPDGVLLAVVDGLGHGAEAAAAARIAIGVLQRHAGEPLAALLSRCHEALIRTRGVVMTLAAVRAAENQLTWLGVGNIEAALLRAGGPSRTSSECVLLRGTPTAGTPPALASGLADWVMLRSGIVGYQIPELRPSTRALSPGDLLIFATDGIRPGFVEGLEQSASPQALADQILERHFKGNDDALVLVVRYLGNNHD